MRRVWVTPVADHPQYSMGAVLSELVEGPRVALMLDHIVSVQQGDAESIYSCVVSMVNGERHYVKEKCSHIFGVENWVG